MTADTTGGFADFYAAHFQRLAVQLHAYLGDHAEAQDLTQEAFCRALDRWSRVGGYDDPAGWVRRVAWNLATSRLRRAQTVARFLARQREEHVPGPSPDGVALKDALATLPAKHRQAVIKFHIGHMSTAEIAEQEGVAEGTVRSWLSRGRSELADYFTEFESTSPVKSAGVAAATETVRRRHRNRIAAVAAMVILAVAIPVAVVLANRAPDSPPVVTPSPSISPTPAISPTPPPTPRPDTLPTSIETRSFGGLKDPQQVVAISGQVIWAFSHSEDKLVLTTDGAATWHEVRMPQHTRDNLLQVIPYSERELVIRIDRAVHISTDGGATYAVRSVDDPGKLAMLADWSQRKGENGGWGGNYGLQCRGNRWFVNGVLCEKRDVVEIGKGPLPVQPNLPGDIQQAITTSDGRLWVQTVDGSRSYVAFSRPSTSDKSWKRLTPAPPNGTFHVSPDGRDQWVLDKSGHAWRLTGGRWVDDNLLASISEMVATGDGRLYVVNNLLNATPSIMVWDGNGLYSETYPRCGQPFHLSASSSTRMIAYCGSVFFVHEHRWLRLTP